MLKIERSVSIEGSDQASLFQWINNITNWKFLMPEDRIEHWEADESSCSFNIKGLASLNLGKTESADNSVQVENSNQKPFPILINIHIGDSNAGNNKISLLFEAKMNPLIKSMAEKPLSNFIEMLGENFKKKIEEN
jgi:hypothetical protein